jgi:hypothetical protein
VKPELDEHTAFHAVVSGAAPLPVLLPQHDEGGISVEPAPPIAQVIALLSMRERTEQTAQLMPVLAAFGLQNSSDLRALFCGSTWLGEVVTVRGNAKGGSGDVLVCAKAGTAAATRAATIRVRERERRTGNGYFLAGTGTGASVR